jgi:MYXO-CTERM domain-containing protein
VLLPDLLAEDANRVEQGLGLLVMTGLLGLVGWRRRHDE